MHIEMKRCKDCKKRKAIGFFYRCCAMKDGRTTRCKPCYKTRLKMRDTKFLRENPHMRGVRALKTQKRNRFYNEKLKFKKLKLSLEEIILYNQLKHQLLLLELKYTSPNAYRTALHSKFIQRNRK